MEHPDPQDPSCPVYQAWQVWAERVAVQEEHQDTTLGLEFHTTQSLVGWDEHQGCILPIIESMVEEVMDSDTPAEAYINSKSALCQVALVSFILGRIHEGAEL